MSRQAFLGCCGADVWHLGGAESKTEIRSILKHERKICNVSIVLVILTTRQKTAVGDILTEEFGFKRVWGPVRNSNSGNGLWGYMRDVNKKPSKPRKTLTKRVFKL